MTAKSRLALLLGAVLTISTIGMSTLVSAGSPIHGNRFVLIEHVGEEHFIDEAPTGDQPTHGDRTVFNNPLYDESDQQQVGSAYGHCTVVSVHQVEHIKVLCNVTATMPGGQLSMQGVIDTNEVSSTIAVVGGTGEYKRARGEVTVDSEDDERTRIHVNLK